MSRQGAVEAVWAPRGGPIGARSDIGAGPADGITFTLQNTPSLGGTGGSLGYGNNLPNSFAVEFNVYQVSSVSIGAGG